jgi:YHS domain-containing protein
MKLLSIAACLALATLAISCNNAPKATTETSLDTTATMPIEVKYADSIVDNKKDPTCGMPVTAGISDTMHYNNKVLGFCAAECKAEFAKDAAKNIASVEWK